ncbi:MAG: SH3 domain-containing protein [candidate division Zixibacteria bacterium]
MPQINKSTEKRAEVIADFTSDRSDPFIMAEGDRLEFREISGEWPGWIYCINQNAQEGWVPESYVKISGGFGVALFPYDAVELSVRIGDRLIVTGEDSGWCRCVAENDKRGWVPARYLEFEQ